MTNITSATHFKYFEKRVKHWVKELGLTSYEIAVSHENLKDQEDALACIRANYMGKAAHILLNKDWGDDDITNKILDRTAYHEVLHLLLFPLIAYVEKRFDVSSFDVNSAEHEVVRRLENLTFGV